MKFTSAVLVFGLFCVLHVRGLNILGLFPHPGKSHFDVFEPLLVTLAEKGHHMTVISHFPQKTPIPRYKDISLRNESNILVNVIPMDKIPRSRKIFYYSPIMLVNFAKESCKGLDNQQVQDFLKTEQKFDVIIMEMFNSDCFLGFVHYFKAPFIGLSSCTIMPWSNERFGNPNNPSYIPNNLLPFSDKMSFFERVENTLYLLYARILFTFFMQPLGYEEGKKYFGQDLPAFEDIANNVSLFIVNTHFSLNRPRPLVPNVIEAAGMFLKPPKKLPEDIQAYLDESKDGVIYFSMGSMIKGHTFPEDMRRAFLNVFSRLPQRVLWKWGDAAIPDKPANVMVKQWLPQRDVLCHPNVKAFISHGGLLGTIEATDCGVPLVLIPQYGDQFTNSKAVEENGGGVVLMFSDVTEERISAALNTILQPSFNKKAKELSRAFRDRPLPALDTAVFWVEYVARHKGAAHMRSSAVGMPLYQYLLLDVIGFLAAVILAALAALYTALKFVVSLFAGKKRKVKRN